MVFGRARREEMAPTRTVASWLDIAATDNLDVKSLGTTVMEEQNKI